MKKVISVFLTIILLVISLTGCSLNNVKQTSAEFNNENFENNIINEIETDEKEIEYVEVVLNSGWKEKQKSQKAIEKLKRNSANTENGREENETNATQETQTNNDRENSTQEIESSRNNYTYYIKVNYTANVVTVYTKDEEGEYTVPYKAMLCSTGRATPQSGVYSIIYKYRWLDMLGGVYAQYCNQVVGNILIHSVPYLTKYDNNSLEYWEYDKLGTSASAGCIRLTAINSKWIYENCPNGTPVEFYSSEEPGPLGKPEEMKISSYTEYRGWDPTDPEENNPWKNYFEEQTGAIISN